MSLDHTTGSSSVRRSSSQIQIGEVFSRLTVIGPPVRRVANNGGTWIWFLCKCECGNLKEVRGPALANGHCRSCGCLQRETTSKTFFKHGGTGDRIYEIWHGIKTRCQNPRCDAFKHYGARGIKLCTDWESLEAFKDWALASGYRDNLSIERIDVNGDYEPANCTWIPRADQSKNRRNTKRCTIFGETKTWADWGRDPRCLVPWRVFYDRVRLGWNPEQALIVPKRD